MQGWGATEFNNALSSAQNMMLFRNPYHFRNGMDRGVTAVEPRDCSLKTFEEFSWCLKYRYFNPDPGDLKGCMGIRTDRNGLLVSLREIQCPLIVCIRNSPRVESFDNIDS